jgi:hypothetical protein
MPRSSKGNVPAAPLKWSADRAATEFGITHNTMHRLIAKNSVKADPDGLYTTKQVTDAIYGGLAEEKLATQRELTKKYSLENQIVEASVLNKAALEVEFAQLADALVSRIRVSKLDRAEQDDLLRELARAPVIIDNVAERQTRLPRRRSKNGQADEAVNES